jgi:hypothetical protein
MLPILGSFPRKPKILILMFGNRFGLIREELFGRNWEKLREID